MALDEDQSGLFSFMVGIIVVVMAGVALSLMVDSRFSFSRYESETKADLTENESEMGRLKILRDEKSNELSKAEPQLRAVIMAHESTGRQLAQLSRRKQDLIATLAVLQTEIPAIDEKFAQYRAKYRGATWAAAAGESLGNLKIRGGREYHQAVIVRVTDVGLEIRHGLGFARVQAPDLDAALQERFQWNNDERLARLKEETAQREAVTAAPQMKTELLDTSVPDRRMASAVPDPMSAQDASKIDSLRRKVIAWRSKVMQLNSDRSEAASTAKYGSNSSVPGSLDTWQAKAARLTPALARAKAELAAAKADLAVVAPDDPLLNDPECR